MTEGQYRAIVAYLNYWTPMYPDMGIEKAIEDIGIIEDQEEVIAQLAAAGHDWNDETKKLTYLEEWEEGE